MLCPACGRELLDGSRFCSWCGRDLVSPELQPSILTPPAAVVDTVLVSPPHPWLRYFARSLDFTLALLLFIVVIDRVGIRVEGGVEYVIGFSAYLVLFAAEILLLSSTGTTIGKWLFRISVASKTGGRPTLAQAAKRSFGVFLRGLALGLPVITIFAQALGYVHLVRDGEARWDQDSNTEVRHGDISPVRAIAIAIVFFVVVVAAVVALMAATHPGAGDTTV